MDSGERCLWISLMVDISFVMSHLWFTHLVASPLFAGKIRSLKVNGSD